MSLTNSRSHNRQFLMFDHSRKSRRNDQPPIYSLAKGPSGSQFFMDVLWQETQQLMERSEQLVHLITHVCAHKLSGVFRIHSCPKSLSCCSSGGVSDEGVTTMRPPLLQDRPDVAVENTPGEGPGGGCSGPGAAPRSRCRKRSSDGEGTAPHSSWEVVSEGAPGGSGAGPPSPKVCKRKQSSPGAPSSTKPSIRPPLRPSIITFLLLVVSFATVAESCSSRSTPKPRPVSPTLRPNVTFQTYACPPAYAAWFCLNGATCFTVKIQDAILYNCECAEGYMGPRCEYKDLDGSYLPASQRVLLETASIAGGACVAIIFVFLVLFALYIFMHKDREKRRSLENPYHDKRPLSTSSGTDYVCTISPVHVLPSPSRSFTQTTQVPLHMPRRDHPQICTS